MNRRVGSEAFEKIRHETLNARINTKGMMNLYASKKLSGLDGSGHDLYMILRHAGLTHNEIAEETKLNLRKMKNPLEGDIKALKEQALAVQRAYEQFMHASEKDITEANANADYVETNSYYPPNAFYTKFKSR